MLQIRLDVLNVSGRQIVQYAYLISLFQNGLRHIGSDKAGSAGHKKDAVFRKGNLLKTHPAVLFS